MFEIVNFEYIPFQITVYNIHKYNRSVERAGLNEYTFNYSRGNSTGALAYLAYFSVALFNPSDGVVALLQYIM